MPRCGKSQLYGGEGRGASLPARSIHQDREAHRPGVSVGCKNARFRIAGDGAKTYIFQAKLNGSTVRVTIGDPPTLDKAQKAARDLQQLVDDGKDPREVRAEQRTASETREAEALR